MDLKSIMRSDSSESPMKGGMLCTADINGGDPCSLCLSVTNSDGTRLLPCKKEAHMFVAVPESQGHSNSSVKGEDFWERVDLGKSCRVSGRGERSCRALSAKSCRWVGYATHAGALRSGRPRTAVVLVDLPALSPEGACSWSSRQNSDQARKVCGQIRLVPLRKWTP